MRKSSANSKAGRCWPIFLGAMLVTTGCANYPQQARIAAFGAAASDLSAAGKAAYVASLDSAKQRAEEEGAVAYLEKGPVFMPDYNSVPVNSAVQWAIRLHMLEAIGGYADALSKIGQPGSAEKAAANGKTLTANIIALSGKTGTASPIGQAAPNLVAGLIRFGADAELAGRMRAVMVRTDPQLRQAVSLLKADFALLARTPNGNASGVTMARTDLLRDLRADRRNSSATLLASYRSVVAQERDSKAAIAAFELMPGALQKLADAHHALVTSKDSDRALADFLAAASAITSALSILHTN
ncbi:MAG: hypothetical protein E5W82_09490 [Mesorhizobium sp.]|nr:MAG: hypothetical protein E5W82_09490 [Mesorhizobium sp.]